MSWASKTMQWTHKLLVKIRFCVVAFTYCPLKSRPSVFWNEMCFCVSSAVSQMKAWCLWPRWFWQLNSFWLLSTCTVWSLLLSPGHKSCQLLVIVTKSKLFVYLYKKNIYYFNTAALPAVSLMGRDRKLFPPAKCLWIEFAGPGKKESEWSFEKVAKACVIYLQRWSLHLF